MSTKSKATNETTRVERHATSRRSAGVARVVPVLLGLLLSAAPLALADTISYEYDALGRVTRVLHEDGTEIVYEYDPAGNVIGRTVRPVDSDGDGTPDAADCDPGDPTVHAGAPEINDGLDNQCPGDAGFGLIDEVEGLRLTGPSSTLLTWLDQVGALVYQVARSSRPDFTADCQVFYEIDSQATLTTVPPPGAVEYYLVRAVTPNLGSWGADSEDQERSVPCS